MIEIIIRDHLSEMLDVPVVMEFPSDPPEGFVVLRKGQGSRENQLDTAMMVVDSYAPSLYKAAQLNEQVKAAMDTLTELPRISASRMQNDYSFTDTRNERYRYQAVYDITHY